MFKNIIQQMPEPIYLWIKLNIFMEQYNDEEVKYREEALEYLKDNTDDMTIVKQIFDEYYENNYLYDIDKDQIITNE